MQFDFAPSLYHARTFRLKVRAEYSPKDERMIDGGKGKSLSPARDLIDVRDLGKIPSSDETKKLIVLGINKRTMLEIVYSLQPRYAMLQAPQISLFIPG